MHFCDVFFFNDTATTEIYTLSLHDALPIYGGVPEPASWVSQPRLPGRSSSGSSGDCVAEDARTALAPPLPDVNSSDPRVRLRSEEHTSELQSRQYLVCRLLLEKKNIIDGLS